MKSDHLLMLKNLTVGYNGTPVLTGTHLNLVRGEICCVIGEEGSGKTTLLKAITKQLPGMGTILYDGIDLSSVSTANLTNLGVDFVAQGGNILDSFTVEEHIDLSLRRSDSAYRISTWSKIGEVFPKLHSL